MTDSYQTVFDLVSHPERIQPPYGFYAVFLVGGLASLGFALWPGKARGKPAWFSLIFSVVFLVGSGILLSDDARGVFDARRGVERGYYQTVEGCLSAFHPGLGQATRGVDGSESWTVNGEQFRYSVGEVRTGYHAPEAIGGFVHADTKVRVAFVPGHYIGKKEIVRLEVIAHACPAAPDPRPRTP